MQQFNHPHLVGDGDANAARIVSCVNALTGIETPEEWVRVAKKALRGIRIIIADSDGVSGWHRKGEIACWYDEFDDLIGDIDAVLAKSTAAPGGGPGRVSCVNALTGIENPEEWVREAKRALKGVRKIIGDSDGVSGWHRKDEIGGRRQLSCWYDEFDDLVGDIDAVLAKTTADELIDA